MPIFSTVLFLTIEWDKMVTISPYLVKFGVLALLGALVSGIMAKGGDVRASVRKGCAAIILGTVLPMLATLWDISTKLCYVGAFAIGLCIDIIYPYLRRYIDKWARKITNEN